MSLDATPEYIPIAVGSDDEPLTPPMPISSEEWAGARAAPTCIVENYLFADIDVWVAPGGTGKTTLTMYEAVHIVLGMTLYGLRVHKRGPVVIVTAEDSRELLIAILRAIAEELGLSEHHIRVLMHDILIMDVSGRVQRLTGVAINGAIEPAPFVDKLADALKDIKPVLVVFDPLVSFGTSEARVNDNEQALIEAGRRIRNALDCCVRFVHHSGKMNAREGTVDQYTGRGGSALPDGARMVHVLQPMENFEQVTGQTLAEGETALLLARPKMSYCPKQDNILLVRSGYTFRTATIQNSDPLHQLRRDAEKVLELVAKLDRPSQRTLEAAKSGLSRKRLRDAVAYLLEQKGLERIKDTRHGGQQHYLKIGAAMAQLPRAPENRATGKSELGAPPPIGKIKAAHLNAAESSPFPGCAGETRRSYGAASAPTEETQVVTGCAGSEPVQNPRTCAATDNLWHVAETAVQGLPLTPQQYIDELAPEDHAEIMADAGLARVMAESLVRTLADHGEAR